MTERYVNIFDKKPQKTNNVPSKRYEPWITVFERLVADAQKQVTELMKQESLYNVVKEFLDLQGLPNDVNIKVTPTYIRITVNALPTNTKADIDKFHDKLAETLFNRKLRGVKDVPNTSWGGSWDWNVGVYFNILNMADLYTVWIIPNDGIADLEVQVDRKLVSTYETTYRLVPRKTQIES